MVKRPFFKAVIFLGIFFVLVKIYHHNLVVTMRYKNQRLNLAYRTLEEKRQKMLVTLSYLRHPGCVKQWAENKGMKPLVFSRIVTLTD